MNIDLTELSECELENLTNDVQKELVERKQSRLLTAFSPIFDVDAYHSGLKECVTVCFSVDSYYDVEPKELDSSLASLYTTPKEAYIRLLEITKFFSENFTSIRNEIFLADEDAPFELSFEINMTDGTYKRNS